MNLPAVLETRLRQAQTEPMAPIDLIACLVTNSPAAVNACSTAAANKLSFAIRRDRSTTSISPSTQR